MNRAILDKASLAGGNAATPGIRAADVTTIAIDLTKARATPRPLIVPVPRRNPMNGRVGPRTAGRSDASLMEGVSRSPDCKAA